MTTLPPGIGDSPAEEISLRNRALDRALLSGIAWTGAVKWFVQLLSWASTFVVAKILVRLDYGVAGMAMLYIAFVQLLNEFGLSAAIVQSKDLTESQIARLGGLSVLLGLGFTLLSVMLAGSVAAYFNADEVKLVVIVLSFTFLASGFQVLPRSLLTRDLRFRDLAILEMTEAFVATVTTLVLALLRYGYWALVIGGVAGRAVSTVMALVMRRHRIAWPSDFQSISPAVTFGAHIVVASIAWYAFRNADQFVVGKLLGLEPLGAYVFALGFAAIPVDRIGSILTRATPAILASVQSDTAALRRYLLSLTEAISLITFPAAVGLAIVADDVVGVIDPIEWAPAVTPLRILALAAAVRSLVPLLNQLLIATGQSGRNMQATLVSTVVLPPLFYLAARWGTPGVAAVWLLGYPLVGGAFFIYHATRTCKLRVPAYLSILWPAAASTLIMAAILVVTDSLTDSIESVVARLLARCAVGVLVYAVALFALHGRKLRESIIQLRATIGR